MTRMTVIGVSASAPGAIGKTSGKAYRIGQIHTMALLAPAYAEGGVEKGWTGTSYSCDPEIVYAIKHLPFEQHPIICEVEVQTQVRFGKREEVVIAVKPVDMVRAPAQPAKAA